MTISPLLFCWLMSAVWISLIISIKNTPTKGYITMSDQELANLCNACELKDDRMNCPNAFKIPCRVLTQEPVMAEEQS